MTEQNDLIESPAVTEQVGADLGNDSLKVVFNWKSHLIITNTVSPRLLLEERRNLSPEDASPDEDQRLKSLDVVIERVGSNKPERFFVGEMAVSAGENETEVGTEKAKNPYIHIPLIAILAKRAKRKEGRFKVVCGLPINQFIKSNREGMKNKLLGTYRVTFVDGIENNKIVGKTVTVIIEDVAVAPEGVAGLTNQRFDSEGVAESRPELGVGMWGIIDIGAFTTDIPVIVNGKPDNLASVGHPEGVSTYLDRIVDALKNKTGAKITRNQVIKRLIDQDFTIKIRGNEFDLKNDIDGQFSSFANKIIGIIDNLWNNKYEIEEFFVIGGGGKILEPYLREVMNTRGVKLSFISMKGKRDYENDPQLQNAFGYWKIAQAMFGV
jgi:hypothetical protein